MGYEWFLARRYLWGLRRAHPYISVIAMISVLGVALGVAALLVVLGVMSGFDADLEEKIVGANPHLVVQAEGGLRDPQPLMEQIQAFPNVRATAPYLQTQVLLKYRQEALGVLLKGVDPALEPQVTRLAQNVRIGRWPPDPNGLLVGSQLARRLGVSVGDTLTVIGGEKARKHEMVVTGEFTTGMYEYDLHLALASLATVQEMLGAQGIVSGIGVRCERAAQAAALKPALQRALGFPHWVITWMDMNQNLFAALALEKVTMFLILILIVLVACFNIVATLLMMVVQKTKEIGILKSLGATHGSIRRLFTGVGLSIGLLGTVLGAAIGLGLCAVLARYPFIQLPAEIYYIDRLPVLLRWQDALAVVLAALGISWATCLYPAWVAARLPPAQALRYE